MIGLRHILAGAFIATALAGSAMAAPNGAGQACYFGVCAAPTASNAVRKLGEHGSWTAYAFGPVIAVMDRFDDGSAFAIVEKADGTPRLVLTDPHWRLLKGGKFGVAIDVDGTVYSGRFFVLSPTMLALDHVAEGFVQAIYHGEKAVIAIGDHRWEMHLADAAPTIDAAAAYERTAAE